MCYEVTNANAEFYEDLQKTDGQLERGEAEVLVHDKEKRQRSFFRIWRRNL